MLPYEINSFDSSDNIQFDLIVLGSRKFKDLFGFECLGYNQRLRTKHKWKCHKAHKQIKTKHCSSVHNGGHDKKLFIKHRVMKQMDMCVAAYEAQNERQEFTVETFLVLVTMTTRNLQKTEKCFK